MFRAVPGSAGATGDISISEEYKDSGAKTETVFLAELSKGSKTLGRQIRFV